MEKSFLNCFDKCNVHHEIVDTLFKFLYVIFPGVINLRRNSNLKNILLRSSISMKPYLIHPSLALLLTLIFSLTICCTHLNLKIKMVSAFIIKNL